LLLLIKDSHIVCTCCYCRTCSHLGILSAESTIVGLTSLPSVPVAAAVNLAYGAKWAIGAPCENYYTLRSQGGPDSSIAGTRTTDIKQGCPPAPPIFKFSYDPKRSDAGGKDGGKDAKKGGSRRRLAQSKYILWLSGDRGRSGKFSGWWLDATDSLLAACMPK
jgi:hypothetical protein